MLKCTNEGVEVGWPGVDVVHRRYPAVTQANTSEVHLHLTSFDCL